MAQARASAPQTTPKNLPRLDDWRPGVCSEAAFTPEECERIIALAGEYEPGLITGSQEFGEENRDCRVTWITPDMAGTRWLFEKTLGVVAGANQTFYGSTCSASPSVCS